MDLNLVSLIASVVSGAVSAGAIALFVWAERIRSPVLEVVPHPDEPDPNSDHIWLHLVVHNRRPPWILGREVAVDCAAYVSFLDPITEQEVAPQISAHWTSQPEPRAATGGLLPSLIPSATRMNVGFRQEKIDAIIKFSDGSCYVADPWLVYRFPPRASEWGRLRLRANRCIVRVELESANLGRPVTREFRFHNAGVGLADFAWEIHRA